MAARLLGCEAAQCIEFEFVSGEGDFFEIHPRGKGLTIAGTSGPAIGMGLHTYLKEVAGLHLSWYGSRLDLPLPLPLPDHPIRRQSWARHRYFLNYCCFSYSMAFWDWAQWERLIDWMVLNGVNRPLAITGQEAVWLRVGKRLGLSDEQVRHFLPGPAYLPFGWMGCLDGWDQPLPGDWCECHEKLGQSILARQRAFGMTPVLQGFTGHVPPSLAEVYPESLMHEVKWHEWKTRLLDPLDERFPLVASIYAEEQSRSFGSDHYYAADTFIEMTPPLGDADYLTRLGRAIYDGMRASDPEAIWVLQGWAFMNQRDFWTQERIEAFLQGVPDDRILILDLHCEDRPMWNVTRACAGKPWLWCNVQNFGRNTHLTAALDANNQGLIAARSAPDRGRLEGLGMVNEGLCYNPIAYEFFFEQGWRDNMVDLADWGHAFCARRYGQRNSEAEKAWEILIPAVYSHFELEQSEHLCRPSDIRKAAQRWWHYASIEEQSRLLHQPLAGPRNGLLEQAWRHLLKAAPDLADLETYRFDLVNLGRQALSDRATLVKRDLQSALAAGHADEFALLGEQLIAILLGMDELVGTCGEFLLGRWLADARRWGSNEEQKNRLELGARRQVTIWGHTDLLRDYARKEWAGLLRGFYVPRWRRYLEAGKTALERGKPLDAVAFERDLLEWEMQWIAGHESYNDNPSGDPVAVSRRLIASYGVTYQPKEVAAPHA